MQEVFEKIIQELKGVKVYQFQGKLPDGRICHFSDVIEMVKQAAAECNNGWIPVEERLPEVPEGADDDDCPEFNVTIKGANRSFTLRCTPDGTWLDEFGHVYPVIAWQPLPEPYRSEEEGE